MVSCHATLHLTKTNIIIKCPTIKLNAKRHVQQLPILNFGKFATNELCDVLSPTTQFIGLPVQLQEITLDIPNATEQRMFDYNYMNATLWLNIMKYQNKLTQSDIRQIMDDILSIIEEFKPQVLQNASDLLHSELKNKLEIAHAADAGAWQVISKIATKRTSLSIFMIIVSLICLSIFIYVIVRCICACRSPPTLYAAVTENELDISKDEMLMSAYTRHVDAANRLLTDAMTHNSLQDHASRYRSYISLPDE